MAMNQNEEAMLNSGKAKGFSATPKPTVNTETIQKFQQKTSDLNAEKSTIIEDLLTQGLENVAHNLSRTLTAKDKLVKRTVEIYSQALDPDLIDAEIKEGVRQSMEAKAASKAKPVEIYEILESFELPTLNLPPGVAGLLAEGSAHAR